MRILAALLSIILALEPGLSSAATVPTPSEGAAPRGSFGGSTSAAGAASIAQNMGAWLVGLIRLFQSPSFPHELRRVAQGHADQYPSLVPYFSALQAQGARADSVSEVTETMQEQAWTDSTRVVRAQARQLLSAAHSAGPIDAPEILLSLAVIRKWFPMYLEEEDEILPELNHDKVSLEKVDQAIAHILQRRLPGSDIEARISQTLQDLEPLAAIAVAEAALRQDREPGAGMHFSEPRIAGLADQIRERILEITAEHIVTTLADHEFSVEPVQTTAPSPQTPSITQMLQDLGYTRDSFNTLPQDIRVALLHIQARRGQGSAVASQAAIFGSAEIVLSAAEVPQDIIRSPDLWPMGSARRFEGPVPPATPPANVLRPIFIDVLILAGITAMAVGSGLLAALVFSIPWLISALIGAATLVGALILARYLDLYEKLWRVLRSPTAQFVIYLALISMYTQLTGPFYPSPTELHMRAVAREVLRTTPVRYWVYGGLAAAVVAAGIAAFVFLPFWWALGSVLAGLVLFATVLDVAEAIQWHGLRGALRELRPGPPIVVLPLALARWAFSKIPARYRIFGGLAAGLIAGSIAAFMFLPLGWAIAAIAASVGIVAALALAWFYMAYGEVVRARRSFDQFDINNYGVVLILATGVTAFIFLPLWWAGALSLGAIGLASAGSAFMRDLENYRAYLAILRDHAMTPNDQPQATVAAAAPSAPFTPLTPPRPGAPRTIGLQARHLENPAQYTERHARVVLEEARSLMTVDSLGVISGRKVAAIVGLPPMPGDEIPDQGKGYLTELAEAMAHLREVVVLAQVREWSKDENYPPGTGLEWWQPIRGRINSIEDFFSLIPEEQMRDIINTTIHHAEGYRALIKRGQGTKSRKKGIKQADRFLAAVFSLGEGRAGFPSDLRPGWHPPKEVLRREQVVVYIYEGSNLVAQAGQVAPSGAVHAFKIARSLDGKSADIYMNVLLQLPPREGEGPKPQPDPATLFPPPGGTPRWVADRPARSAADAAPEESPRTWRLWARSLRARVFSRRLLVPFLTMFLGAILIGAGIALYSNVDWHPSQTRVYVDGKPVYLSRPVLERHLFTTNREEVDRDTASDIWNQAISVHRESRRDYADFGKIVTIKGLNYTTETFRITPVTRLARFIAEKGIRENKRVVISIRVGNYQEEMDSDQFWIPNRPPRETREGTPTYHFKILQQQDGLFSIELTVEHS